LHSYGLPEGYDKLLVADIIVWLIEALKGIGTHRQQAHTGAHQSRPPQPSSPAA
jgi:hypothetical protein